MGRPKAEAPGTDFAAMSHRYRTACRTENVHGLHAMTVLAATTSGRRRPIGDPEFAFHLILASLGLVTHASRTQAMHLTMPPCGAQRPCRWPCHRSPTGHTCVLPRAHARRLRRRDGRPPTPRQRLTIKAHSVPSRCRSPKGFAAACAGLGCRRLCCVGVGIGSDCGPKLGARP